MFLIYIYTDFLPKYDMVTLAFDTLWFRALFIQYNADILKLEPDRFTDIVYCMWQVYSVWPGAPVPLGDTNHHINNTNREALKGH